MAKKKKAEPETVLIKTEEIPQTVVPYNPLDKHNLAVSVADALLASPIHPLPPAERAEGSGIYAIYYTGDFPAYAPIAKLNADGAFQSPIYIGKAIPKGSRKGKIKKASKRKKKTDASLFQRLSDHYDSITSTANLNIKDFHCRYLLVDDIWIPLGERMLIQRFSPVWNQVVDGFGNNDPGIGRKDQKKSHWDMIHPGRAWLAKMLNPNKKSAEVILKEIEEFLKPE